MSQGLTPGVPGAPEPRMYPRSGYFLVVVVVVVVVYFSSHVDTVWLLYNNILYDLT